jgi:cytochrome c oxidase assembly protein subunit 15
MSALPTYKLVRFAVVLAFSVVVLGAFTRLMDAGLGCPDWPGCYGHLWMPQTESEIASASDAYPLMPFEFDKAWPEVVHRYFAGSLGLIILAITIGAWRNRSAQQPLLLPIFLLVLVIIQAAFGMWTVTLNLWPQVVTGHLLGGFTTLTLLWLLRLRLQNQPWPTPSVPLVYWQSLRRFSLVGLLLVIVQILLGGWTSTNYAALACPDLPTCQGSWWPRADFSTGFNFAQEIGPNYLGGQMDAPARVAIHLTHRIGAVVVTGYLIFLLNRLYRVSGGWALRRQAKIIAVVLALQVSLGISNVYFELPLWVAVAHNAVGALLLMSMVSLNYHLYRATQS